MAGLASAIHVLRFCIVSEVWIISTNPQHVVPAKAGTHTP